MTGRLACLLLIASALLAGTAAAQGAAQTIRAIRVPTPLRIDGRLDDPIYATEPPLSGFVQQEPREGAPATEKTEVWLFFDRDNVYVVARCWESAPDRVIANEMRRDHGNIANSNDAFAFTFDTFYDRRNSVIFHVTPIGGRMDGQGTNERQWSSDWNPIWDFAVAPFDGGWVAEIAIPFKSLRYRAGREQTWGFNARRINRWKNEVSFLSPIPAARGLPAIMQVSLSATLVGLEAPEGPKSLDIKPVVTADLTSDAAARPRVANDVGGDIGLDAKYGVTQNLAADFTYNTDFAQVEADEQQINLTRFNLFFPEKREFFLENQGLFAFGGASNFGGGDTPILFYSRRIGLSQGRAVPLDAGGRLTGRLGRTGIGVLNIQADDEPLAGTPPTNFSVVRLTRDVMSGSTVGVIFTNRSAGESRSGANQAFGVDGRFRFFDNLDFNTYWARTRTGGRAGEETSYRAQLDYAGDRYGAQVEHLRIGDDFNPDVGFLRRDDMRKSAAVFRFSPRPRTMRSIRRFSWVGGLTYIENGAGRVDYREAAAEFAVEFQSGDRFSTAGAHGLEFIPRPFGIGPGVVVPVGGYDFDGARVTYSAGQQRRLSGTAAIEHATFYGGHKTAMSVSRGRVNLTPRFSVEPSYAVNWIDGPQRAFMTHLFGSRVTYTVTPMMFASTLVQYNSVNNAVTANARLRWEYRPGSELFVVYNEQRDTLARSFPALANRALIVKVNRLFRF